MTDSGSLPESQKGNKNEGANFNAKANVLKHVFLE